MVPMTRVPSRVPGRESRWKEVDGKFLGLDGGMEIPWRGRARGLLGAAGDPTWGLTAWLG